MYFRSVGDADSEATPGRIANPNEFFSWLYFNAHGRGVSQQTLHMLEEKTRSWLKEWSPVDAQKIDSMSVGRTRYAFDARRQLRPASEYEFALRNPPDRDMSLSVTDWQAALRSPAIVWMKAFVGVQSDNDDANAWALATGQWVHRWLADSVRDGNERKFVSVNRANEIREHITTEAREFRESIAALCARRGRVLPDWWCSGWSNALYIADSGNCRIRKISSGEGVERTFQTYSPLIAGIEVKRRGDVRRAKLYYLRERSGKSARIKEKLAHKAAAE